MLENIFIILHCSPLSHNVCNLRQHLWNFTRCPKIQKCLGGTHLSCVRVAYERVGPQVASLWAWVVGGHTTAHAEPCPHVVSTAFMPDTAGCLCDVSSAPVSERSVPVGWGGRKSPYSFHKEIFKIVFVLSIFFLMRTLYFKGMCRNGYAVSRCSLCFSATRPPRGVKATLPNRGDVASCGDTQGSEVSQSLSRWEISNEMCPKFFHSSANLGFPVIRQKWSHPGPRWSRRGSSRLVVSEVVPPAHNRGVGHQVFYEYLLTNLGEQAHY